MNGIDIYSSMVPDQWLSQWDVCGEESRECRPEAESKEKHGAWDPMPELTITSPYVDTFTIGNPMPESTLSPSQGLRI